MVKLHYLDFQIIFRMEGGAALPTATGTEALMFDDTLWFFYETSLTTACKEHLMNPVPNSGLWASECDTHRNTNTSSVSPAHPETLWWSTVELPTADYLPGSLLDSWISKSLVALSDCSTSNWAINKNSPLYYHSPPPPRGDDLHIYHWHYSFWMKKSLLWRCRHLQEFVYLMSPMFHGKYGGPSASKHVWQTVVITTVWCLASALAMKAHVPHIHTSIAATTVQLPSQWPRDSYVQIHFLPCSTLNSWWKLQKQPQCLLNQVLLRNICKILSKNLMLVVYIHGWVARCLAPTQKPH